MGARMWRTLVTVAGLAIVAVTTGTAVLAAIDDQDDPPAVRQTLDAPGDGADVASICLAGAEDCDDTIDSGEGTSAPMCAPGHPDCDEMIVDGGFNQCATDEPCGDFDQRCAANADCVEPGFLPEEPVCPEGMTYDECFPDGTPAGWDCVQLESFPVQIKCYPIGCTPIDGPVTILPAPAEDLPLETEVEPVDPSLVDPTQEPILIDPVPAPSEPYRCLPDCGADPIPDECLGSDCAISSRRPPARCLPPECTTFEDGTVACPVPLPTECAPDEQCLPPDCSVSSDGVIACPEPLPCAEDDAGGCSAPGSCGDLGCDPATPCPEGTTPEECEKILEEQRRNGGSSTSSGGDVDPQ